MNGLYGTVRCHQITYHHLATLLLKNFNTDSRVNSLPSLLGLRTINKSGRSAHFESGMPMTAPSATPAQDIAAFSRSTELIHSPPDLITSLDRSVICMNPSASMV